jgi:uroporphyrinogen decarboxylase
MILFSHWQAKRLPGENGMNSRERVRAAIAHKQPDMVPVDLGATPSSGISAIAYGNLTRHLGMEKSSVRIYDVVQQLAQPEDAVLDRFGIDAIDIGRSFNTLASEWVPTTMADGKTAFYPSWFKPVFAEDGSWNAYHEDGTLIARMPVGATFFDETCFPYLDGYPGDYRDLGSAMDKVLWSKLVQSPWDHASEKDFWTKLRSHALHLKATTDRALVIVAGCNLFEWGTFLRRMDNFLMDIYAEPEEVERLLDALMEKHLATLEKVCAAVGDVADVLRFGDDLGLDTGGFMSPDIYRSLFKPRHAKLCAYVKEHSGMATFLHSCGSIYELLPDLIDAGYDIINPVQTNARNMEPERLKMEFGKDITFWGGGIDTRTVLNNGTPAQVRAQVLERLKIFSPGGGFVFNTVHNMLPDVPPANIVAMFDAVADFNGTTREGETQ